MDDDNDIVTAFRPSKRRKVHRRRVDDAQNAETLQPESITGSPGLDHEAENSPRSPKIEDEDEEIQPNVRRLIPQRRRGGGIGFSTGEAIPIEESESHDIEGLSPEQAALAAAAAKAADMGSRFAKQSGFKVEVNKHMMAYVDAEIARRKGAEAASSSHQYESRDRSVRFGNQNQASTSQRTETTHEASTTAGALQEVEVTPRGSSRNTKPSIKSKAPKLGPDGKPWRGRRNRRTSDDMARDALVEAMLSERTPGQVQHYQNGGPVQNRTAPGPAAPGANEDADERAVADFERQSAEAAQERRRRNDKPPRQSKVKDPAVQGLIANGPKLGGSRSQRAKMHALEAERLKAMGRKL